jgi:hypothetical protein
MARFLDRWRSEPLPIQVALVLLALAVVQLVEVVLYSFLLPVTG